MPDVLPISCFSCRRLKIKCDKLKPCNQCTRRNFVCEFPSTYRNAAISKSMSGTGDDGIRIDSQSVQDKLLEELVSLRTYHSRIVEDHARLARTNLMLNERIKRLELKEDASSSPMKGRVKQEDTDDNDDGLGGGIDSSRDAEGGAISISGETSELGKKYYGPQSSSFMIENLKSSHTDSEESNKNTLSGTEFQDTNEDEILMETIKRNKNSNTPGKSSGSGHHNSQHGSNKDSGNNNNENTKLIEKSLTKKELPKLVSGSFEENYRIILKLVDLFFEQNVYYQTFISKPKLMDFLTDYKSINDHEWEYDDDLLLLYLILILSIQRLTPREFENIGLLRGESRNHYNKYKKYVTRSVLFHHFERLRHNLINESILTIQSYILCTEWYLIEQRYEESWSMMFHTCSISYAIGLHAMRKLRFHNVSSHIHKKNLPAARKSFKYNESELEEEETDIDRFKVWFALKNICGQICSVLGRPNPISIQVNSIVLKSVSEKDMSSLDMSERNTQVLLKTGLSECLRLSNMMLIENFMIDFSMGDLINLNERFSKEIGLLEWYQHGNAITRANLHSEDDSESEFPSDVDESNVLTDLIFLYINRAKLFEPFINKFEGPAESKIISNVLRHSIFQFLDYTLSFITLFFKKNSIKYSEFGDIDVNTNSNFSSRDLKFGRLFRVYYPFLNAFVYQGIIVIFTFLHYKFKDFINNFDVQQDPILSGETVNYNDFLRGLQTKLNDLLSFGSQNSNFKNVKLWSSNIIQLIEKINQHIRMMYEKQQLKAQRDREIFEKELNDYQSDATSMQDYFGFNISDPFWLRNPDNFPYYLSSPSDELSTSESLKSDSQSHQMQRPSVLKSDSGKHLQIPSQQRGMSQSSSSQSVQQHPQGQRMHSDQSVGTTTGNISSAVTSEPSTISNIGYQQPQPFYLDSSLTTPTSYDPAADNKGAKYEDSTPIFDTLQHQDSQVASQQQDQRLQYQPIPMQSQQFIYQQSLLNSTQPMPIILGSANQAYPYSAQQSQPLPLTSLPVQQPSSGQVPSQQQQQQQQQPPHSHQQTSQPQQGATLPHQQYAEVDPQTFNRYSQQYPGQDFYQQQPTDVLLDNVSSEEYPSNDDNSEISLLSKRRRRG